MPSKNLSDYMPQRDALNGNIAAKLRAHCQHRLSFQIQVGNKFTIHHWNDADLQTMTIDAKEVVARSWEDTAKAWLDYLHEDV